MQHARWFTSITTDTNTHGRHVIQKDNISKRGKNRLIQTNVRYMTSTAEVLFPNQSANHFALVLVLSYED